MAIHNTSYDAANTAVRAFLTEVGAMYWGRTFNTGSGSGKSIWLTIKNEIFKGECCYCGIHLDKLQIEHLIMFNREEYGLHHPGNIVPVCLECNKRGRDKSGKHIKWEEHLENICVPKKELENFGLRKNRILKHINEGKFAYPQLSDNEKHAIRVIAESIYQSITGEIDKSLKLYGKITEAFVSSTK
jgi:hypothetical protein